MKVKLLIATSLLTLFFTFKIKAQVEEYQATYIYNFLTYIQWSGDYKTGEIVIGVLGNNEKIEKELKYATNGKRIGSRSISIKTFSHPGVISKCNILVIPSRQSAQIEMVAKKMEKTGTLVVSSSSSGIAEGADINFAVVNKKLGFEINSTSAAKKNIGISMNLKRLAVKVY